MGELKSVLDSKLIRVKLLGAEIEPAPLKGYLRVLKLGRNRILYARTWNKPQKSALIGQINDELPEWILNLLKISRTYYDFVTALEEYYFVKIMKNAPFPNETDKRDVITKEFLAGNGKRCLQAAVAMQMVLEKVGIGSKIIYGFYPDDDNIMRAHAWIAYMEPHDGKYYPIDPSMRSRSNIPLFWSEGLYYRIPKVEGVEVFVYGRPPALVKIVREKPFISKKMHE